MLVDHGICGSRKWVRRKLVRGERNEDCKEDSKGTTGGMLFGESNVGNASGGWAESRQVPSVILVRKLGGQDGHLSQIVSFYLFLVFS